MKTTATEQDLKVFQAYQHFLYYFDQKHFKANSPFEPWLTRHFIEKLTGIRSRYDDYNSIQVMVRWVQEMAGTNQRLLLDYILSYHLDKW